MSLNDIPPLHLHALVFSEYSERFHSAGEMAQSLKCLPCTHKDPSSIPKSTEKEAGMVECPSYPSAKVAEID